MVKSGTDFRQLSDIVMTFPADSSRVDFTVKEITLDSRLPEDQDIKDHIKQFTGQQINSATSLNLKQILANISS